MTDDERLGVYVAVARIMYLLAQGDMLTTQEIATLIGRTRTTAYRLMIEIESSHHVPVYFDNDLGAWKLVEKENT
jgi:DNA-binding IclR family transcriptional regulator